MTAKTNPKCWAGLPGPALASPSRRGRPSADQIVGALRTITANAAYRQRASALAAHFAHYTALETLEYELAQAAAGIWMQ